MTIIKVIKALYVKLGGSLTDTISGIANGAPVADYTVISDCIKALYVLYGGDLTEVYPAISNVAVKDYATIVKTIAALAKVTSKGITPTGKITITENGTDIDVAQYATADVDVPGETITLTPNNTIVSDDTTFVRAEVDASFDEQYEVTIPNTVTTILGACFNGNAFVTKITMPNSVTTINDGYDDIVQSGYIAGAMANCQRLKEVVLSENITVIPLGCFYNDTSLENLIIPDGVTQIKSQAFNNCTGLESIVIPDSCTSFGNAVFYNCKSLTDIYYTGTQLEWEAITGLSNANIPADATIHYEYTPE